MKAKQTSSQNGIQAGIIVRLTEKKIKELASKNELSYFPVTEGRVKRVFQGLSPVYSVNFGGNDRILIQGDVEPVN